MRDRPRGKVYFGETFTLHARSTLSVLVQSSTTKLISHAIDLLRHYRGATGWVYRMRGSTPPVRPLVHLCGVYPACAGIDPPLGTTF